METAGSCKYRFLFAREISIPTNSLMYGVFLSMLHSWISLPDRAKAPYANRRPRRQSFASCSFTMNTLVSHKSTIFPKHNN